jgi:hypothetical protein
MAEAVPGPIGTYSFDNHGVTVRGDFKRVDFDGVEEVVQGERRFLASPDRNHNDEKRGADDTN